MRFRLTIGLAWAFQSLAGCGPGLMPGPSVAATEWPGEIRGAAACRAGVLYQDGGQSIAVPNGSLWVFGDTFLGDAGVPPHPLGKITGSVGNTVALLPAGSTDPRSQLRYAVPPDGSTAGVALDLLPGEDRNHYRIWPAGGTTVGGRTYLYYTVIEVTDAPGPWNFHGIGGGLAVGRAGDATFRRLTPHGSWHYPAQPICVLPHDGYLYCYEVGDATPRKGLFVARVRASEIEDPGAYTFFDGRSWTPRREGAAVVLTEAYGQASVVWNPALRRFLLATSSDFFHPQEIQLRTSPTPVGPWSAPTRIAVPPSAAGKTRLVYGAFIHPELSSGDGRSVAVTFCRQLEGEWAFSNPELARLQIDPTE